jgi:hypothetical protein
MFRYPKMEDDIENEVIKLYNLKSKHENHEKEVQELDDKEEDLNKNKYYKIEEKKLKELEKVFKQTKIKIKLNNYLSEIPDIIFDQKREGSKNICIVYDNKIFSKLIEIETSASDNILFVEKLDNNDLIFIVNKGTYYELLVYRNIQEQQKEKKGYYLSQKIKETYKGYKIKYNKKKNRYFCFKKEKKEPINYILYYVKAISGNRFFCVSNYGFKIYTLNENNEYELVLLESYDKIDFIYEIDTNEFIIGLNIRTVEGYGFCGNAYTCYHKLLLNKIILKNIDKTENKTSQEKINGKEELENNEKNNDNLDIIKAKQKLKLSFISQTMFKFEHSSPLVYDRDIYFSDFVILKNKFFMIMVNNNIFVFNMETGKKIKKFKIIVGSGGFNMDIKNWDSPENDEFILIVSNNIILFKLNEENSSKISLNILNYAYFPELVSNDMRKFNSQKNRFYIYNKRSNDIFIY